MRTLVGWIARSANAPKRTSVLHPPFGALRSIDTMELLEPWGIGMRRRLGGYRTGASNVCAEKLWRRLAKWALAASILATIPTGAFASAAQECAASMARRDRLDHNGFKSRAKRYGLRAENVAYGCATEECARAMWWKSPGHARNMMLPGFNEVASARSRSGRTYWCIEIHE